MENQEQQEQEIITGTTIRASPDQPEIQDIDRPESPNPDQSFDQTFDQTFVTSNTEEGEVEDLIKDLSDDQEKASDVPVTPIQTLAYTPVYTSLEFDIVLDTFWL